MAGDRTDVQDASTVTFTWDGEDVEAHPGEPIAVALWRAGYLTQTRSLKYHRPRGPMCLTGDCPGCMVRVDGVPNVRGCRVPARQGLTVESQTGWPSAQRDVLSIVDRIFERFDHERSFVRPEPVNRVYETVARRLAGFGSKPTGDVATGTSRRLTPDVLVAGAGPAGLAAARGLLEAGEDVLIVDERFDGGSLSYRQTPIQTPSFEAEGGPALVSSLLDELPERARLKGTVVGLYEEDPAVVLTEERDGLAVHRVEAEDTVLAVGGYEGAYRIPGNDTPGVLGARAARILLGRWGVAPGDPVALIDPGRQGRAFKRLAADAGLDVVTVDQPDRIEGGRRVEAVVSGDEGRSYEVEAAIVDPGLTPAPELGRQAGVPYTWDQALGGRVPLHRPEGTTPVPSVYVAGSCAGLHTVEAALVQGRAAALAVQGKPPEQTASIIEDVGGLSSQEIEAARSVWNA